MADETQDADFEETVKDVGKGCVVLGTDGCASCGGCLSLVVLALAMGAWSVVTLVGLLF